VLNIHSEERRFSDTITATIYGRWCG